MPLLKNKAFVNDEFVALADDAPLPTSGHVLLSLKRLQDFWGEVSKSRAQIGLRLTNTDKEEALAPYLAKLVLIILPFPAFNDGRSYSIARQLRLDGYKGELRAEGNVLPDQLQFMTQVGFDTFQVTDRFPLEAWQKAAQQMSLAYQRGLYRNEATEVWSSRHKKDVRHAS